jgi:HD-like signal output (HDOD) protein
MTIDADKAMKELVAKGIKIPPQPKVLIELRKLLSSDDYDVRKLARIISQDPGISAMLFKAARSPVFGRGKKFDAVEQVIMVVGVKQTFNLVQAMALASSVTVKSRKAFDIFWTRSQEIAQLAAIIAEDRISVCNVFPDLYGRHLP